MTICSLPETGSGQGACGQACCFLPVVILYLRDSSIAMLGECWILFNSCAAGYTVTYFAAPVDGQLLFFLVFCYSQFLEQTFQQTCRAGSQISLSLCSRSFRARPRGKHWEPLELGGSGGCGPGRSRALLPSSPFPKCSCLPARLPRPPPLLLGKSLKPYVLSLRRT